MEIFWFVLGGIVLAIVVATVTILVGRNPELPPAEPATELPSEADEPGSDIEQATDAQPQADETTGGASEAATDVPEPAATRLVRLRRRLSASNNPFARGLLSVLAADRMDAEAWDDLEATLISADLGVGPTEELVAALRRELSIDGVADPEAARRALRAELLRLVGTDADRSLSMRGADGVPGVILVVGVNGTGKT
ncbi:MAG TPA: signal recognition particle-docking protein FtsY, partial [Propionibacteriaceae bacterium]|nr:signal recognition particle-docking protein FtsY [Propionibacteriaceae bacterium]